MQVIEGSSQCYNVELLDWISLNLLDSKLCSDRGRLSEPGNVLEDTFHLLFKMLVDNQGKDYGRDADMIGEFFRR